jgi:hypothetical protein
VGRPGAGARQPPPPAGGAAAPARLDLVAGALRKARIALRERRLPISPRRWLQLWRLHTIESARARHEPLWPDARTSSHRSIGASSAPATARAAFGNGRPDEAPAGLTIVGYLADGTGVSAAAHASARACAAANIPFELVDARPLEPARGKYAASLLHVNADQTTIVAGLLGRSFFAHRYTIGYWAWELDELPSAFDEAFDVVDEIWALSSFVQRAVAARSPVPVVTMPPAVTVAPAAACDRAEFGLPRDCFLFLVAYDLLSVPERKNPLGALAAFRRAFPAPRDVGIVVRANHFASRPDDAAAIRAAVEATEGAFLVERPLAREQAQALQQLCDAFVSLHRAEGFGLNIAEAMLLGKPVIVTGWSGNLDFTDHRNACLVDYQLVTLAEDTPPYPRGSRWAEPDLDQAAEFMLRVASDQKLRRELEQRGRATVDALFAPAQVGTKFRQRLETIGRTARSGHRAGVLAAVPSAWR